MPKLAVFGTGENRIVVNGKSISDDAEKAANSTDRNIEDNPYPKGSPDHEYWASCYQEEINCIFDEPGFYFDEDENIRNIFYYICLAKDHLRTDSNRKLSQALNLAPNAVSGFETGKTFPSPETMVEIATLAGQRADIAACELSIWKTRGKAQETYRNILKRLTGAALALLLLVTITSGAAQAQSANNSPDTCGKYTLSHNKMAQKRGILSRFLPS